MRCGYCYGRLNTAMQCESCGKYSSFPAAIMLGYEEAETLVAALEAAEKERDEWRESARTANTALLKVCKERDALAAYAAKLEKAGDAMYGCSAVDFDKACVAWEAARKEKPGA